MTDLNVNELKDISGGDVWDIYNEALTDAFRGLCGSHGDKFWQYSDLFWSIYDAMRKL
jgi:hypothetical protein